MTEADHVELLNALKAHRGGVMISGYFCDLYADMLRGWRMKTITTTADRAVQRTECLWLNEAASRIPGQTCMRLD
jgi:DNA adenine methylase